MSELVEQLPPSDAAPEILRGPAPSYAEILAEIERLELALEKLKRDAGVA